LRAICWEFEFNGLSRRDEQITAIARRLYPQASPLILLLCRSHNTFVNIYRRQSTYPALSHPRGFLAEQATVIHPVQR